MDIRSLRLERGEVIDAMRALLDTAESESRDLTEAEQKKYNSLNEEQQALEQRIERGSHVTALGEGLEKPLEPANRPSVSGAEGSVDACWRDTRTGQLIHVYGPGDKIQGAPRRPEDPDLGDIVRSMLPGRSGQSVSNALTVGTDSEGGYLAPEFWEREVIEKMREKMRINEAGARTVLIPSGTFHMARVATEPTPTWRAEAAAVTESTPSFEEVIFNATSLDVLVKASVEVLEDASNMNDVVLDLLSTAMAMEVDRVAMFGTGSSQPTGIVNQSGVLEHDMGTNGAALTRYTDVMTALQLLAENNASDPTAAIMAPRTYFALEGMEDANNQPLRKPEPIGALPFLSTGKVPVDETHGTATDASSILLGDFSQLMIGVRTGLELMVANELYRATGQVGFFARMRVDIQLAQPKAFCKITGITP